MKRTIKRPAKRTTIGTTAIKRAVNKVGTSGAKTSKKKKYEKPKQYPILKRPKKGVSYISVLQVAKRLKVSLPTVYGWVSKGLFKGTTKDQSGHWMVPSVGLKKPTVPDWHFSSRKTKKKKSTAKRKNKVKPIGFVKLF